MPKLKKKPLDMAMDMLSGLIKTHQKVEDISDASMARVIGSCEKTYKSRLKNPETFTVSELISTAKKVHLTEEELLTVIRMVMGA